MIFCCLLHHDVTTANSLHIFFWHTDSSFAFLTRIVVNSSSLFYLSVLLNALDNVSATTRTFSCLIFNSSSLAAEAGKRKSCLNPGRDNMLLGPCGQLLPSTGLLQMNRLSILQPLTKARASLSVCAHWHSFYEGVYKHMPLVSKNHCTSPNITAPILFLESSIDNLVYVMFQTHSLVHEKNQCKNIHSFPIRLIGWLGEHKD